MTAAWGRATTGSEVARRAGGRARYNGQRQAQAALRLESLIEEWEEMLAEGRSPFDWGGRTELAARLGVSKATVTRDIQKLRRDWGMADCPLCGSEVGMARWDALEGIGRVAVIAK